MSDQNPQPVNENQGNTSIHQKGSEFLDDFNPKNVPSDSQSSSSEEEISANQEQNKDDSSKSAQNARTKRGRGNRERVDKKEKEEEDEKPSSQQDSKTEQKDGTDGQKSQGKTEEKEKEKKDEKDAADQNSGNPAEDQWSIQDDKKEEQVEKDKKNDSDWGEDDKKEKEDSFWGDDDKKEKESCWDDDEKKEEKSSENPRNSGRRNAKEQTGQSEGRGNRGNRNRGTRNYKDEDDGHGYQRNYKRRNRDDEDDESFTRNRNHGDGGFQKKQRYGTNYGNNRNERDGNRNYNRDGNRDGNYHKRNGDRTHNYDQENNKDREQKKEEKKETIFAVEPKGQKCWPEISIYIRKIKMRLVLRPILEEVADMLWIPFKDFTFKLYPRNIINIGNHNYRQNLKKEDPKLYGLSVKRCISIPNFKAFAFVKIDDSNNKPEQLKKSFLKTKALKSDSITVKKLVIPISPEFCDFEALNKDISESLEGSILEEITFNTNDPDYFSKCLLSFTGYLNKLLADNEVHYD